MATRGSTATATIALAGMVKPRYVALSDVRCSWGVSMVGTFSATISWEDYAAVGNERIRGRWLIYEHPTCGVWGGVITDINAGADAGVGFVAYSFAWALLETRRTAKNYKQASGAAGGLALRAITDAQAENSIRFADIIADEGGPIVKAEWRGDSVLDVVNQLASDAEQEWLVTTDTAGESTFAFKQKAGRDLTNTFLLREGSEIVSPPQITSSIYELRNDLVGVPGDRDWEQAKSFSLVNQDSIDLYGRLQAPAIPFERLVYGSSLNSAVHAEMKKRSQPITTGSITLPDSASPLATIRDGDSVMVSIKMLKDPFVFRVMTRSADIDGGTVDLAGDTA